MFRFLHSFRGAPLLGRAQRQPGACENALPALQQAAGVPRPIRQDEPDSKRLPAIMNDYYICLDRIESAGAYA